MQNPHAPEASSRGALRRRAILHRAVDLGSRIGLENLTVGRLASAAGMSRSGVFAHFGSKQEIQLATVAAAQAEFEARVLAPVDSAEHGLERLRGLVAQWLGYVETIAYSGGCFFFTTTSEFGSRKGVIHDRLASLALAFVGELTREARTAVRQGELQAACDPELLVFCIHACVQEANWARELFGDRSAFDFARRAIGDLFDAAVTTGIPPAEGN